MLFIALVLLNITVLLLNMINSKAGLNYETPEGKSMFGTDFESVDENAVRLDLDDLGGEIVSCILVISVSNFIRFAL